MDRFSNRKTDGMGRVMPDDNSVTLTPPPGAKLDGESGEASISWSRDGDSIKITAINGVKLGGEDESAEDPAEEASETPEQEQAETEPEGGEQA